MFEYVVYLSVVIAVVGSVLGFREALQFRSRMLRWCKSRPTNYPVVTLFSPQRGEPDLNNLDAILNQKYPGRWEVIFVTTAEDRSRRVLEQLSAKHSHVKLVLAADVVELARMEGVHRGQKSQNLIEALAVASDETEVYAVVDADACPFDDWLKNLIAPLCDDGNDYAATTSMRLYLPGVGLFSWAQVAWVLVSSLMQTGRGRFLWGGGMAITRDVFEKENLISRIDGSEGRCITSEDLNISRALSERGHEILFVPDCIVPRCGRQEKESLSDVMHFTNRQLLQGWWASKSTWFHALNFGLRGPLLVISLVGAFYYPLALVVLISPFLDFIYSIMIRNAVFTAEPRVSFKLKPWVLLLPFVTLSIGSINVMVTPLLRKMEWSGVHYTRTKVLGYSENTAWRAVKSK